MIKSKAVVIAKEVKSIDGWWRFACSDVLLKGSIKWREKNMYFTRAGKSKSLIRWKRLKGGKRRKKAEKANLIYN